MLPGFLVTGENLSLKMLRAGWADVYEQANAEYGDISKDVFDATLKEAQ